MCHPILVRVETMNNKQFLLLVLVLLLTACESPSASSQTLTPVSGTPDASTPVPAASAPPGVTSVTLWTVLPDHGVSEQALDGLIQAFQKDNPTIHIKVEAQPTYTELFRKVVASVAAGTLPDMVTGLDSDIAQYVRLRALMSLDNYVHDPAIGMSAAELDDIPPALAETMRIPDEGSTIYSLPFARGVMALYYDWGAMKAIGITNTPKTWDEFKLHATTLSKNPVRGLAYRPGVDVFESMLLSRGGSLYSADLSRATFNAPAGVDALTFLANGVRENWIYRAEGNSDMLDFAAGRTIFNVAPTSAIPNYAAALHDAAKKGSKEFEWGVTALPQADPTTPAPTLLVGSNIAILKSTPERQQAAWLFARWLMRDKNAATWTKMTGVLPARQAARAWLKDYFDKTPQQQQALDTLLPNAHLAPNIRPAPEVRDLIDGALNLFEGGKTNARTALDDAAAKATVLLKENH